MPGSPGQIGLNLMERWVKVDLAETSKLVWDVSGILKPHCVTRSFCGYWYSGTSKWLGLACKLGLWSSKAIKIGMGENKSKVGVIWKQCGKNCVRLEVPMGKTEKIKCLAWELPDGWLCSLGQQCTVKELTGDVDNTHITFYCEGRRSWGSGTSQDTSLTKDPQWPKERSMQGDLGLYLTLHICWDP